MNEFNQHGLRLLPTLDLRFVERDGAPDYNPNPGSAMEALKIVKRKILQQRHIDRVTGNEVWQDVPVVQEGT